MTTTNVLVTRTGTNWTVDVTPCELDPDITLKDFVVLISGSAASNVSFNKTTATTLTYVGASLPANTQVEIRRRTPNVARSLALLGSRVRSADWNGEFNRVYRRFDEIDVNGAGTPVQSVIPRNDPFGVIWNGDVTYPPTRNALYQHLITLSPLSSPAFTGTPTVPTAPTTDNSTTVASTAHVKNNLFNYATLNSPNFTGNPTVPTAGTGDNSTSVANTAHVKNVVAAYLTTANAALTYAPLASPTFTGTPSVPTAGLGTNTTQAASTAFAQTINRPIVDVARTGTPQSFANNTFTTIIFNTEFTDLSNVYNPTNGNFTIPTTGYYTVSGFTSMIGLCNLLAVEVYVNGVASKRLNRLDSNGDFLSAIGYTGTFFASANDVVTIRLFQANTGAVARNSNNVSSENWATLYKVAA